MESTVGKTISCKAAISWDATKPMTIETIEVAPPKAGEVRMKVSATGICRSDEFYRSGQEDRHPYPCILGHEGSGIVESVGDGVTSVAPGDHVISVFIPHCRKCKMCQNSKSNMCTENSSSRLIGLMPDGTSRFTCKGQTVHHTLSCSMFSEYTVICEINVAKIDKEAPLDKVCLLGCGVSTGYGAPLNNAKVEEGSTCAIWGIGAVGLAVIMGCKVAKASRIIAVDINPAKEKIAREFGATDFVNPKSLDTSTVQHLVAITDGGLDYTFECIGNVQTMREALESCHKGWGLSTVLGISNPKDDIKIMPFQLVTGRTWQGSLFGGWKGRDSVPGLVKEYMSGAIKLDEFISHKLSLDRINEGFDLMLSGKSVRSVIIM
ncbi:alcohol dehydrogenase class-3 chain L-like [Antedon mediterranea]|uniref:alcohol dehydrogenase class-3 chain L-like n=1 Tax=Antedon mediterranea TaxID=105859 RepID=UPI003AF59C36